MIEIRCVATGFVTALFALFVFGCGATGSQIAGSFDKGTINDAWTMDGKCQAVLAWVNKLQDEYPNIPPQRLNVAHPGIPNLLRQKYFVPVFGVTYSYKNAATLKTINDKVLYQCYGLGTFRKYANEIGPYKLLFDSMFVMSLQGQAYRGVNLPETVSSLESTEAWMGDTLKMVQGLPLADKSFSELDSRLAEGNTKLKALWPSEHKTFISVMTQSKTNMAGALLGKVGREVDGMEPTVTNARRIKTEIIPNAARYQAVSSGIAGSDLQRSLGGKLESIVNQLVQQNVAALKAIPDTENGLKESEQWYRKFEEELSVFKEFSSVSGALALLANRRDDLYRAAKPTFLFTLNSLEAKFENVSKADSLLQQSFALPNDLVLPVYQDYERAVRTKKEQIVAKLVDKKLSELKTLPASIDSAVSMIQWRKDLEDKYGSFRNMTPVTSALNEYANKRGQILQGARREFEERQSALPATREGLRQSVDLLDAIFPKLEDEQLPVYRDYKQVVLSRIVSIRSKLR